MRFHGSNDDDLCRRARPTPRRLRRVRAIVAATLLFAPAVALAQAPALTGTSGEDTLKGAPGADAIFGLAGNDAIDGAAGDDDLDGGSGADDIRGGSGSDAVVYGDRSVAVAVTLDDVANDGEAGEGDDVHSDVEQIFGGGGGDRLTGSGRPNVIDGAGGDDSITDGGGADRVFGGAGDDVVTTFDGVRDVVDCGPGTDTLTADRSDQVTGCEKRIPARRVRVGADFNFSFRNGRAVVSKLTFTQVPGDATAEVRCSGGCAVSVVRLPKGRPKVVLAPLFRGRPLPEGARLEVRFTQQESIGAVFRFDMLRSTAKASRLCLPPGGQTPMKVC